MPPTFVTCYICGRDFGTRSIGIHVPKCQEKWEVQQEKLPRADRRDLPKPPENFQRILSGEVTGKELMKLNEKAAEDYKNEVLKPCNYCGRTFLPEALVRHKKGCREDKPMSKKKGPGYTAQAKSRVNYPKLKSNKTLGQSDHSSNTQPQSPSLIRKETITISKPATPHQHEDDESESSSNPPSPTSSINRKDTVILSRPKAERPEKEREERTDDLDVESVAAVTSSLPPDCNRKIRPTKDKFIQLIETEAIFESEKHRRAILEMVTGYARNVRRGEIMDLLDNNSVFEDVSNLEEVITILTDYVRSKTNNNQD